MSDNKKCNIHRTSIGGQAVIEGIMMKGQSKIATAVRKTDGEIVMDTKECSAARKSKILKLPIIRGCINFFDSMILGVKALMYSAKFFDVDEDGNEKEEQMSKFEEWLMQKLGSEKGMNAVIYFSVFLSLVMSVGLFMMLPAFIVGLLDKVLPPVALTLVEGVVRIAIFLVYLALVARMNDIKRVFMYHGAEHKTIHCYEMGLELTVENVRKQSRLHPRCGTSFLLVVMVVSIIVFSFISWENAVIRLLLRLALLPVVAGISYEFIKLAGRYENGFTAVLSAPGKWLQYITTNEPDDSQIEVAIAAIKEVIPEDKSEDKW